LPGLGDHDVVLVDIQVQPEIIKQKPREIYLYDRANRGLIWQDIENLAKNLYFNNTGKTTDELWGKFKDTVLNSMRLYIPCKLTKACRDLPWVTSYIRKQM